MKRIRKFIIIALSFTMLFITSCSFSDNENKTISKDTFMLDTLINVTIYGSDDEALIDKAFEKVNDLENILSVYKENSELYNIKLDAGIKGTKVSDETMNIIEKSLDFYHKTNKAYDITLGPLIELWDKCRETETLPDEETIKEFLHLVNSDKIKIDKKNNIVTLEEGMFLDLGASAKGYIADVLKTYLKENGVKNAIINLGGNINIIGSKLDSTDFNIGIRDPNSDAGSYLGVLSVSDTSIVTSGDYERYFEKDGKRYHHIIDPSTGYPVENDLRSVTIVSENSLNADILSTSVFLLGLEEGMEFIENMNAVEAIFVTKDKNVYVTKGLKDKFKLTNEEYIYND